MQKKLYTVQFFSSPHDQCAVSVQAVIVEPQNHKFCEIPKKVQTSGHERIRTHRKEKSREASCPRPTPIHKLSLMPMVWNIAIGQPGLAAWLYSLPAPARWLNVRNWKKILDFIATAKSISVINILLVLNPKRSSY